MTISGEVGGDDPLYLDDLQVGQRFTSKTHVVDAAQIKAFARQFDPQPFHLDDNAAKDSLFSGLVASGWHLHMRLQFRTSCPGEDPGIHSVTVQLTQALWNGLPGQARQ
jgi:acyl dehydratase